MDSNKSLVRAGYFIAALLILLPLYDATSALWPLHLGDERWRYGALGTLSNLTLVPMLGLFIAIGMASIADHRRTRRVLGWLSTILAIVLAALLVLFILDYFQTRASVKPQVIHAMAIATGTAAVKHVLAILGLLLLGRGGLAGPRPGRKTAVAADISATPLIPLTGADRVG